VKLTIAAVGRLKGPERDLEARYLERVERLGRGLAITPLRCAELAESRARAVAARKSDEAGGLLAMAGPGDHLIALDESGRSMASRAFADLIRDRRDDGLPGLIFALGGPDGHGGNLLARADLRLSLSAMTLAHGLARVVLLEQIYRALTIIAGHPYHRG